MSRSRGGMHRHRQPWVDIVCDACGQVCQARRTLPGKPWHVQTHITEDGICSGTVVINPVPSALVPGDGTPDPPRTRP